MVGCGDDEFDNFLENQKKARYFFAFPGKYICSCKYGTKSRILYLYILPSPWVAMQKREMTVRSQKFLVPRFFLSLFLTCKKIMGKKSISINKPHCFIMAIENSLRMNKKRFFSFTERQKKSNTPLIAFDIDIHKAKIPSTMFFPIHNIPIRRY